MTETKAPIARLDYSKPVRQIDDLNKLAKPLLSQVAAAMPGFLAKNAERLIRCLLTECQRSPKLMDCSPRSLFGGVIQVAQLGLELGGPAGQAYLIPFKGEASLVIGYKGFIALAHRSGKVRRITPRLVREGDTVEVLYGTEQRLYHRPDLKCEGAVIGYYCAVELDNGGTDFEFMTRDQAEAHRDRFALSKSGPWATSFDEMALKTCIRKLAKRLPLSVEWVAAATMDQMADEGISQQLGTAVVLEEDDRPASLRDKLDKAKSGKQELVGGYTPGVDDPDSDPKA